MEMVTMKGFLVRDSYDLDTGQDSLDVYDNDNDGVHVGTLYGRSFFQYENDEGEIDTDRLDADIDEAFF